MFSYFQLSYFDFAIFLKQDQKECQEIRASPVHPRDLFKVQKEIQVHQDWLVYPENQVSMDLQVKAISLMYILCSGSIVVNTLDCGPGGPWFKSQVARLGKDMCTTLIQVIRFQRWFKYSLLVLLLFFRML